MCYTYLTYIILNGSIKGRCQMSGKSIVYTNDNCIGCNKCINVCSAIGACISSVEDGKEHIVVDGSKCVACGSCIDVCVHGAREFEDDTERFFEDLKRGEKISILLAPAFKANYPDEYNSVLGGLKDLGVNRIISVSFGADITTWGYLNYIEKYDFYGGISQPCPAVVSYIERYLPELIPNLFPVQSPLMCAAIYMRKELGVTDRLAFISPCIAKKLEIEDPQNKGLVQYNVTFEHLMRYVFEHGIRGEKVHSEIEYGMGSFYPTPGGLAENVRWFLGDQVFIRQIEGERHLYEWMRDNSDRIRKKETPFLFIDALNCEKGCICGTAVNPEKSRTDDALYALLNIREEVKKQEAGNAWSRCDSPGERLKNYNKQFENLKLEDYLRGYTDRSSECSFKIPDEAALDSIFNSMNKTTKESREINCTCCGYESCKRMATAIYNGFNHKENCIYYEKAMVHELELEKAIAEEATKAKSAFLSNMSHEIRTPINAILGMNEMILRECEDKSILEYSESIRSAGDTLLNLVNNILDLSKIENRESEIMDADYETAYMNSKEERKEYREKFTAPDAEVLVVDDTPMNLIVFKRLLKKTGVKIDAAASGDEALNLMSRKKYDIIFLDHMMPGKDGVETLHELKEKKDDPNISTITVCLTANAISGAKDYYISEGFDDYLSKPIDTEKLEDMLLQYLPKERISVVNNEDEEERASKDNKETDEDERLSIIKTVPGINSEAGIKYSGSLDSYFSLVKIFCASIDKKARELEDLFAAGDFKVYTIKMHAVKSALKIVGSDLGDKAQRLESAGKSGDTEFIRREHRDFMDSYRSYKTLLEPFIQKCRESVSGSQEF